REIDCEALHDRRLARLDVFLAQQFQQVEVRLPQRRALARLYARRDFAQHSLEEGRDEQHDADVEHSTDDHPNQTAVHNTLRTSLSSTLATPVATRLSFRPSADQSSLSDRCRKNMGRCCRVRWSCRRSADL